MLQHVVTYAEEKKYNPQLCGIHRLRSNRLWRIAAHNMKTLETHMTAYGENSDHDMKRLWTRTTNLLNMQLM